MAAFNFHRRKTRRWWYAGATLMALAFFTTFFVVGAGATLATSPSNFESNDGNMTVEGTSYTDWNCFANGGPSDTSGFVTIGINKGTGTCDKTSGALNDADPNAGTANDISWVSGQKMDLQCAKTTTGNNPAKDTFNTVAQYNETDSSNNLFLYGATIRATANGDANENIELSKNPGSTACPINRSAGDKLLQINFSGNAIQPLQILTYYTTLPTGVSCFNTSTKKAPCWANPVDLTTGFEGAVDTHGISAANNGMTGQTLVAQVFAEFGVNLSDALSLPSGSCSTFGQETWESRSSSSFSSNPEDIEIIPHTVSNCGEVIMRKVTSPANTDHSFAYTSTLPVPTGSPSQPSCLTDSTPAAFSLNDKGYTITGITAATHAVVTTSTANNFVVGQRVTISGSTSTPTLNGDQIVTAVNATHTAFTIAPTTTVAGTAGTVVGNNEDCTSVLGNTGTNNYTVTETADANYTLSGISCANSSLGNGSTIVSTSTSTGTVTFHLKAGDTIDCTYTNTLNQGALVIRKESTKSGNPLVANAGATFCFSTSTGCTSTSGAGTVTDGAAASGGSSSDGDSTTGLVCVSGLTPGDYKINETAAPSGYAIGSSGEQTATVVSGTDCSSNEPSATSNSGSLVSFLDPPLADVIIAFRDGGSAETSLAQTMTCIADNGTGTDGASVTTPSDWTSSDAITGVQTGSSDVTVTCTAVIDPKP